MRTKIKSSVFRQKRKKFCNALTFTKWWLLLEIIFNGSSGEPQSRTLACSFVIKIFASDLFLQIYSRGNFCSFFVLFVPLFSPYFCSTGFVFFLMSFIGFDIFFLSRYRIAIVCFFVSFQILIAQCYSVISTSFFGEFSLTFVVGVTKVVQEVLSI